MAHFISLSSDVINAKIGFIKDFMKAENAATGSTVDANSNVTNKDVAVMEAELYKDFTIQIGRKMVCQKMYDIYPEDVAKDLEAKFKKWLHKHYIYVHDETALKPYCASVSLYPFLLEGTKCLGGTSDPPKNLRSFCGSFCNLVYQLASNFAGAIATVEFLMYFDHFARHDYGDNYLNTHAKHIAQELQGVVYTMNQPAAARGNQSVFWNISLFDKGYFDALFGEFVFPDGDKPNYDSLRKLQNFFLEWFRKERHKAILTFPVVTAAYLIGKDRKPVDKAFEDALANAMSRGLSFFHYESDKADSLSSCCRLRNELADNQFSYTLGAGGVSTGSFKVITLNVNRIIQDTAAGQDGLLEEIVHTVPYFLNAYREIVRDFIDAKMLPAYDAGFIALNKQFGTIGVNGVLESFEYLNKGDLMDEDVWESYVRYLQNILNMIKESNVDARNTFGYRFNTEFVPAENLGVKNAKWDKEDGYVVPRNCYNSYFFPVESSDWDYLSKLAIHGMEVSQYLDGGAACHINLKNIPDFKQAKRLIELAALDGVPYWTTNVLTTICDDCGYIDPFTRSTCSKCGSHNVEYATRVIGYLKPIKSFSKERQKEAGLRVYEDD